MLDWMATIIGESGAWKDVLSLARSNGLTLVDPPDVGKQLSEAQRKLQQQLAQVEDNLAEQQTALKQQVAKIKAQCTHDAAVEARQLKSDVALLEARLTPPEGRARRWFAQLWTRLSVWCASALRRSDHQEYVQQLDRKVTQVEQILASFITGEQSQVDAKTAPVRHAISALESIAASSELPGAIAEKAVIKELGRLPNEYVLMNDVRLEYHRYIHFDGEYLKTAQLDHVLIGPAGVYVIETKNWSQEFVANGEYFSPFKQVKRASYLCYRILKEAGCSSHVRSVVACAGAVPPKPPDSHIAVVPITRLLSFVQYGERVVSPRQIDQIRRVLS